MELLGFGGLARTAHFGRAGYTPQWPLTFSLKMMLHSFARRFACAEGLSFQFSKFCLFLCLRSDVWVGWKNEIF